MYLLDVNVQKTLTPIQSAELQAFLSLYGFGLESHAVSAVVIDPEQRIVHISEYLRDDGKILTSPNGQPLQKSAMRPFKDSCEPPLWVPQVAQRIIVFMVPDIDPSPELPLFLRPTEVDITLSEIHIPDDCLAIQATVVFTNKGIVVPPDDIPEWVVTNPAVLKLSSVNADSTSARINVVDTGESDIVVRSVTNQGTVVRFTGHVIVYESGNVADHEMSMTSINPVEVEGDAATV